MKKMLSTLFALALVLCVSLPSFANQVADYYQSTDSVTDVSDLFTDSQEEQLRVKIAAIKEKYNFDIALLTVPDIGGSKVSAYADDYYDYNGFGVGENRDGLLFMLNTGARDYYTSTRGFGETAFTDYGIEKISDEVVSYLSDGEYYQAFDKYLDMADVFIAEAKNGNPYDVNHEYKDVFDYIIREAIVIGFALLVAAVVVFVMKSMMNNAKKQDYAQNYVSDGSFVLTNSADMYMYRRVSKTKKVENSSGGGGSSTHISSSGASHGGGGGKY